MPYLTTFHFFLCENWPGGHRHTGFPNLPVVVNAFDIVSLQSPHRYGAPIHTDHKENHSSAKCSQEAITKGLLEFSKILKQGPARLCLQSIPSVCSWTIQTKEWKRTSAISPVIPHLDELYSLVWDPLEAGMWTLNRGTKWKLLVVPKRIWDVVAERLM